VTNQTFTADDTHETAACACQCAKVSRRSVLGGLAAAGAVVGMGGTALAATAPESLPPQVGDFLVISGGTKPLKPEDIRLDGNAIEAVAMSPDGVVREGEYENTVQLLRLDPATLPAETVAMAADGVLGFTIICTHAGCPLSGIKDKLISCDCHGSRFDPVKNGAVAHGPAVRKLPQLGLAVKDGNIVVAAAFDSRIGGDMMGEDDR
jgi:rieske iron-sulfur protein